MQPEKKTFNFIGVTTGQSSVNRLFPKWMRVLGREDVKLVGVDHPLNDSREAYRETVSRLKADRHNVGALVTSHKLNLTTAARDLFDHFDPLAELTGEVSCIAKRDNKLWGFAKDPITAGQALTKIIGAGYFGRTGGDILCLGAGGAGLALLLNLLQQPDSTNRPTRFFAVDLDRSRLDHMQGLVDTVGINSEIEVELRQHTSAEQNDALMRSLPPHTVIINATGMGKDRPGSPLSDGAVFPEDGIVWEFNYRGERLFLQQANAQKEAQNLTVVDGWDYFIFGWLAVVAEALQIDVTPDLFAEIKSVSNRA